MQIIVSISIIVGARTFRSIPRVHDSALVLNDLHNDSIILTHHRLLNDITGFYDIDLL